MLVGDEFESRLSAKQIYIKKFINVRWMKFNKRQFNVAEACAFDIIFALATRSRFFLLAARCKYT